MASYAEMVAADKLAAKKKIEAKKAEKKKLKKIADAKRDAQFKGGKVPTGEEVTVTNKNNKTTTSRDRGPKVNVRQGTPDQKRGTKVQTAIEKKPEPKPIPKGLRESIAKDKKKTAVSKGKVKASASNTKDFENTKRIQKELKDLGVDIKVDGIMGAKTRAAMAKYKAKPKKVSKMTTKEVMERGTYNLRAGGKGTYKQRQAEIQKEKSNKKMAEKMIKTLKMKK